MRQAEGVEDQNKDRVYLSTDLRRSIHSPQGLVCARRHEHTERHEHTDMSTHAEMTDSVPLIPTWRVPLVAQGSYANVRGSETSANVGIGRDHAEPATGEHAYSIFVRTPSCGSFLSPHTSAAAPPFPPLPNDAAADGLDTTTLALVLLSSVFCATLAGLLCYILRSCLTQHLARRRAEASRRAAAASRQATAASMQAVIAALPRLRWSEVVDEAAKVGSPATPSSPLATSSTSTADDDDDDDDDAEMCAVCLSAYEPSDTVIRVPCGHTFHEACVSRWLSQDPSCPTCRFQFLAATSGSDATASLHAPVATAPPAGPPPASTAAANAQETARESRTLASDWRHGARPAGTAGIELSPVSAAAAAGGAEGGRSARSGSARARPRWPLASFTWPRRTARTAPREEAVGPQRRGVTGPPWSV